jgi:pimeloyl-ACP methyl ester carboxylesterase
MDALVADLGAVARTIDGAPVLIGASMGGLTSLVAVGEGYMSVRGLVLVDVAPRVEAEGLARITDFMSAAPDGFGTLEEAADAIAAYTPGRKHGPGLNGLRKNLRLRADGRWHWHWDPSFLNFGDEPTRSARHLRLIEAAAGVRAPTLIVRGTRSDVVSAAGAAELLSTTPGAREVTVAGAGHMLVGDDNDIFSREVIAFLADLPMR